MLRRGISLVLVFVIALSSMTVLANARSSDYLSSYSASLRQGDSTGTIKVQFSVFSCAGTMTEIGVSKIQVYNSNGTLYRTINGSTSNNLLKANSTSHGATYHISCVAGSSYYCRVTVIAKNSSGSDSRTLITGTVTAHP